MLIIISFIFLNITFSLDKNEYLKTYSFGEYKVETDICFGNTSIRILQNNNAIYYNCGGDGVGYCGIDTITLNTDKLPDFIYCYQMEEYITIGVLVSNEKHSYRNIDVINVFPPEINECLMKGKNEILKNYILKNVDKDGKRDLLTNVLEKNGQYVSILNFTDTIPYSELKAFVEGKIKGTRSRGEFLRTTK